MQVKGCGSDGIFNKSLEKMLLLIVAVYFFMRFYIIFFNEFEGKWSVSRKEECENCVMYFNKEINNQSYNKDELFELMYRNGFVFSRKKYHSEVDYRLPSGYDDAFLEVVMRRKRVPFLFYLFGVKVADYFSDTEFVVIIFSKDESIIGIMSVKDRFNG